MPMDYSNNFSEQQIIFLHAETGESATFKPFDFVYGESIVNDWEETVYPARINRGYVWTGVIRSITMSWSLPAFDVREAKHNFAMCSKLIRMMYPVRNETGRIEGGSSYWYLGFMNWAHNPGAAVAGVGSDTLLSGFPSNFNWDIVGSDGYLFDLGDSSRAYPKNIKVSCQWTVLLDEAVGDYGWINGKWGGPAHFPWADESDLLK